MTLKKKEKDARGPRGSKKWRTIARMQQALGVREDWSAAVRQLTAIKNGGDSGARSRGEPRVAGAKEKRKIDWGHKWHPGPCDTERTLRAALPGAN